MYTDIALKLKAFTLAVGINALLLAGAAYLFDGHVHQPVVAGAFAQSVGTASNFHVTVLRP